MAPQQARGAGHQILGEEGTFIHYGSKKGSKEWCNGGINLRLDDQGQLRLFCSRCQQEWQVMNLTIRPLEE